MFLGNAEQKIPEEALEEAFAEVDTEGNGEISFGQFKQLIHNLLA